MTLTDGLIVKISHCVDEVKKVLSDRSKEQEMPITSLPNLSKKIWGIQRKRLYVIGARTGIGKSAFAIQCAYDVAKQGKKVLFLSLESTVSEIIERIFCNRYSIDNFSLTCGHFEDYHSQWEEFTKELTSLKFLISDSIGSTMPEIQSILQRMTEKPDLLVIDYIQMIKGITKQKNEDIAEFVKELRLMAVRNNMAIWLVSQVNREGDGEMPTLAQLKGSGVLEEHPDVVFLLHATTEETGSIKNYYFYVAKNRNGLTGKVKMQYFGKHYQFKDAPVVVVPSPQESKIAKVFSGSVLKKDWTSTEEEND